MTWRTLTVTAAEWASRQDGTLWLVREPSYNLRCDNCGGSASLPLEMQCANHLAKPTPPVEFVQASAPCVPLAPWYERAHAGCDYLPGHFSGGALYCNKCGWAAPCPDCRIELEIDDGFAFPVVVGHAYPVGRPLPIIAYQNGEYWLGIDGAIRVPAAALGGASRAADDDDKLDKWALQLVVTQ